MKKTVSSPCGSFCSHDSSALSRAGIKLLPILVAVFALGWLGSPRVQAASDIWNNVSPGDGQWGSGGNWNSGAPPAAGATATFSNAAAAASSVTISNSATNVLGAISVSFTTVGSVTINAASGGELDVPNLGYLQSTGNAATQAGGTMTINAPVLGIPYILSLSPQTNDVLDFTSAAVITGTTSAAATVTFDGGNLGNNIFDGAISNQGTGGTAPGGTWAVAITKTDPGLWTFGGTNTNTGNVSLGGGTTIIDFSQPSAPASNIFNNGVATAGGSLSMNGTQLVVKGKSGAANSQQFFGFSFTVGGESSDTYGPDNYSGMTTIALDSNGANSLLLSLGAVTRTAGAGTTLDIVLPTGSQTSGATGNGVTTTSTGSVTNGVLVGTSGIAYATIGETDWAGLAPAVSGTSNIVALSDVADGGKGYNADNFSAAANNVDVTLAADSAGSMGTSSTVNTLRFNSSINSSILTLTGSEAVGTGGILVTTNALPATMTSGTIAPGAGKEMVIDNFGSLTINSTIGNAAAGSSQVTLAGPGTTILGGSNTYTGATYFMGGTVDLSSTNALAHTSGIQVSGNTTIDNTSGNPNFTLTNNPTVGISSDLTFVGSNNLNLGAGAFTPGGYPMITVLSSTLTISGTLPAVVNVSRLFTKDGLGTLNLTGASPGYAPAQNDGVTINAGTVLLSLSNGGTIGAAQFALQGGIFGVVGSSSVPTSQTIGTVYLQTTSLSGLSVTANGGFGTALVLGGGFGSTYYAASTLNLTLPSAGAAASQTLINGMILPTGGTAFVQNGIIVSASSAAGLAYATVNQSNWAAVGGVSGSNAVAYSAYSTGSSSYTTGNNIDVGNSTANATDTPASSFTVNTLRFNASGLTLTTGGTNYVTAGGILATPSSSGTISGGTIAPGTGYSLIVSDYGALTISSVIANYGGNVSSLVFSGTGTTTLTGVANTISGNVYIDAGTVVATKLGASGATSSIGEGSAININGGGTLRYAGTVSTTATENASINVGAGAGSAIDSSGVGPLILSGNVTPFGNTIAQFVVNQSLATGGTNIGNTLTLTGVNTGSNMVTGMLENCTANGGSYNGGTTFLGLTKTGAGTWIINGRDNAGGPTFVNAGTLLITGSSGGMSTTSNLVIAAGAIFGTVPTDTTPVSILGSGTNRDGGLSVLNSDAPIYLTLGSSTATESNLDLNLFASGTSDTINASKINLTGAGTISLQLTDDSGSAPSGTYTIMTWQAGTGITLADINLAGTSSTDITSSDLSVSGDSLLYTVAVPEPGTWAMIVGGVGMLIAARRRFRRIGL